jgi:DNA-directed RNA polymerase specialized sigma24 family protein
LETNLIAELYDDRSKKEFRSLTASSQTLCVFPTAIELIQHLHRHQGYGEQLSSDEVLLELLRIGTDTPFRAIWQRLFLLVFIPTIHRTASQITATFPLLTRDDTAQCLFAVLLEFLDSAELRLRRSHLAFTIARKIRRSAFRWAIRESRTGLRDDTQVTATTPLEISESDERFKVYLLLKQFLDDCQRRGLLSPEERDLLTEFKLEGISGPELAHRSGHSVIAVRHRIQRLVDRLRRVAQKSGTNAPQELDLFSK